MFAKSRTDLFVVHKYHENIVTLAPREECGRGGGGNAFASVCLSVCLSVRVRISKTFAPIDFIFLHRILYFHSVL